MKFLLLYFLISASSLTSEIITDTVTINLKDVPFKVVAEAIKQQTGYRFNYNMSTLAIIGNVTVTVTNEKVKNVLKKCLKGKPVIVEIGPDAISLRINDQKNPSSIARGPVIQPCEAIDEQGRPVEDLEVQVKNGRDTIAVLLSNHNLYLPDSIATIIMTAPGFHPTDTTVRRCGRPDTNCYHVPCSAISGSGSQIRIWQDYTPVEYK